MSAIQWTDETWNPTTGCDRVSPGCDNCYALTMAARLKGMGQAKYQTDGDPRTSGPGFGLAMHPDTLDAPLRWRKPRRVFVNSMSDLFHPKVTDEFIVRVFATMAVAERHTFQVLTKRPKRMRSLLSSVDFSEAVLRAAAPLLATSGAARAVVFHPTAPLPNVWLGTSVEDQRRADERIPALLDTPAAVRFLSCEPLLGPVRLDRIPHDRGCECGTGGMYAGHEHWCGTDSALHDGELGWVIVGGESGPGARPMDLLWAARIVEQCRTADVATFVKQLGSRPIVGRSRRRGDHDLWPVEDAKGGDPEEWPTNLRVRDYPQGPA